MCVCVCVCVCVVPFQLPKKFVKIALCVVCTYIHDMYFAFMLVYIGVYILYIRFNFGGFRFLVIFVFLCLLTAMFYPYTRA